MRFGYWRGYIAGQREASVRLERVNAVLTEQIADLRFTVKAQTERADRAVDLLVQRMGLPKISASALAERSRAARVNMADTHPAAPFDPFKDLPIGHPDGEFKTLSEAELRAEDARGQ